MKTSKFFSKNASIKESGNVLHITIIIIKREIKISFESQRFKITQV